MQRRREANLYIRDFVVECLGRKLTHDIGRYVSVLKRAEMQV